MMLRNRVHLALVSAYLVVPACTSTREPGDTYPDGTGTVADGADGDANGDDNTGDNGDDGDDGNDGPSVFDVGVPKDVSDECAGVSETATAEKQPADILFVVDNSGSMTFEAEFVQDNLNDFSHQIIDSGIDVQVALLSSFPGTGVGICIDPPLGSGDCPNMDSNPPRFIHVNQEISSWDALDQIIARHPSWKPFRRPEAGFHVVVVSDDNGTMDAATFDSMFTALDPSHAGYSFHGIVAIAGPLEDLSCLTTASQKGQVYMDLIDQTGGVLGNLCAQDFQPVFDELTTAVVTGSQLSCEWVIPDPPNGMEFNRDKVNVAFDDGTGNTLEFGRVESPDECANVSNGWYYDDPDAPTKILVCPQTCEQIQGFEEATIQIVFGCDSNPAV